MKKKLLINQLISAICIIVIILGIIVVATKGFEKSLDYAKVNRIELYLENGYNKEEITQIAKDTFGEKKFQIYDVDKFNRKLFRRRDRSIKNISSRKIKYR